jgi:tetratricopeptide (TPR) repeat protein
MWEDRLVEVWAPPGQAGAGLAVSDLGILTARHVVEGALRGGVEVRIVSRGTDPSEWVAAEVIAENAEWDLAILQVKPDGAEAWPVPRSPRPTGAMPGTQIQECEAVGFPEASVQRADPADPSLDVRQSEQVAGTWLPMGQAKRPPGASLPKQWIPVDVTSTRPMSAAGWAGMSGAAVLLHDGRLAGVVIYAEGQHQQGRLYAVPLAPAVRDSEGLSAALIEVGATDLAASLTPIRVLHRPPDLVPNEFRDRATVLEAVLGQLVDSAHHFAALVGERGIGKTAIVTRLLQQLEVDEPRFKLGAFEYISARGNRAVTVSALINVLARSHPVPSTRTRLLESTHASHLTWWAKLAGILRELHGTRVLIVMDDFHELLDGRGEIRDKQVREILEYLAQDASHGVQVLFVSSAELRFPLSTFGRQDAIQIPDGLPPDEDLAFLADLAPENVDQESLADLCKAAKGRPRTLELISCLLRQSFGDVSAVRLSLAGAPDGRVAPALLGRILLEIPRPQVEVLRAVAIFGRPVPAGAVNQLTGQGCGDALAQLAELRLTRIQRGGRTAAASYYLPPDEAHYLVSGIEPSVRQALSCRAAAYFTAVAAQADVRSVADLGPHFGAIELHVAGEDHNAAFVLMNTIEDEFLDKWGHHDVLVSYREDVTGHLGSATDEVDNLVRLAYALGRLEEHDSALEALKRARNWNSEVLNEDIPDAEGQLAANLVTIALQTAGTLYDVGRIAAATDEYEAISRLPFLRIRPEWDAATRLGAGNCLTETGRFDEALGEFRAGLALLEQQADRDAALLRCQLTFSQGVAEFYRGAQADDAPATFALAHTLADGFHHRVLAAQIAEAMAAAAVGIDDNYALELAQEAAAVAAETGNPELARVANGTLALIHLRQHNDADALAAAAVAVEFWRARRAFAGFTYRGIALLRDRQLGPAASAFLNAHDSASRMLSGAKGVYQLHEFSGLALAGLSACSHSAEDLGRAEEAYSEARRITLAPGAVRLCLQRLDTLLASVDEREFARIRAAARGARLSQS